MDRTLVLTQGQEEAKKRHEEAQRSRKQGKRLKARIGVVPAFQEGLKCGYCSKTNTKSLVLGDNKNLLGEITWCSDCLYISAQGELITGIDGLKGVIASCPHVR